MACAQNIDAVVASMISNGYFSVTPNIHDSPYCLMYDMDAFSDSLDTLSKAFPSHFRHHIAVKTNPLARMLRVILDHNMGLECASIGEVYHSLKCGAKGSDVVFDSPVKTVAELEFCLRMGVCVNCDNLQELARVKEMLRRHPQLYANKPVIGLRINPLVGEGSIKELSVSGITSKFGTPYRLEDPEAFDEAVELIRNNKFISCVHVHVGSQGCDLSLMSRGVALVARLCEAVNNAEVTAGCPPQIRVVDIGGGLPTNFDSNECKPTFDEYSRTLQQQAPNLFDGSLDVITEFGRALHAKVGWVISRVEYTKNAGDRNVALIHCGSDMFVRPCNRPETYYHRVRAFGRDGTPLEGELLKHDIAGPLCFGGDIVARQVDLPELKPFDFVVLLDSGANCFSLWSHHCSRKAPRVYGYYRDSEEDIQLELIRESDSLDNVSSFWGNPYGEVGCSDQRYTAFQPDAVMDILATATEETCLPEHLGRHSRSLLPSSLSVGSNLDQLDTIDE